MRRLITNATICLAIFCIFTFAKIYTQKETISHIVDRSGRPVTGATALIVWRTGRFPENNPGDIVHIQEIQADKAGRIAIGTNFNVTSAIGLLPANMFILVLAPNFAPYSHTLNGQGFGGPFVMDAISSDPTTSLVQVQEISFVISLLPNGSSTCWKNVIPETYRAIQNYEKALGNQYINVTEKSQIFSHCK